MANTLTERITRLTSRIERWDEQIASLTEQRDNAVAEATALLAGATPAAKTSGAGTKSTRGPALGERIMEHLLAIAGEGSGGATRENLALKFKVTATQIGLALYHLENKKLITKAGSMYYYGGADSASVAARTTPGDISDMD